jgi:hypothetical protein
MYLQGEVHKHYSDGVEISAQRMFMLRIQNKRDSD